MNFVFHPEAETEFFEAISYYEEARESLGFDFASEVYSSISSICTTPKLGRSNPMAFAGVWSTVFPYGVLYSESEEEIFIYAVMHLHRDPDYWKKRI